MTLGSGRFLLHYVRLNSYSLKIITILMTFNSRFVALSMAEIVSAIPTSGGPCA